MSVFHLLHHSGIICAAYLPFLLLLYLLLYLIHFSLDPVEVYLLDVVYFCLVVLVVCDIHFLVTRHQVKHILVGRVNHLRCLSSIIIHILLTLDYHRSLRIKAQSVLVIIVHDLVVRWLLNRVILGMKYMRVVILIAMVHVLLIY